jgi:hypothetical protein
MLFLHRPALLELSFPFHINRKRTNSLSSRSGNCSAETGNSETETEDPADLQVQILGSKPPIPNKDSSWSRMPETGRNLRPRAALMCLLQNLLTIPYNGARPLSAETGSPDCRIARRSTLRDSRAYLWSRGGCSNLRGLLGHFPRFEGPQLSSIWSHRILDNRTRACRSVVRHCLPKTARNPLASFERLLG